MTWSDMSAELASPSPPQSSPKNGSQCHASDDHVSVRTRFSSVKKPGKRRKSVQNLIDGFHLLRAHIPASRYRTSMSRIETLRLAILRIQDLTYQLQTDWDWPDQARSSSTDSEQADISEDTVRNQQERGIPMVARRSSNPPTRPSASMRSPTTWPSCPGMGVDNQATHHHQSHTNFSEGHSSEKTTIHSRVTAPREGCGEKRVLHVRTHIPCAANVFAGTTLLSTRAQQKPLSVGEQYRGFQESQSGICVAQTIPAQEQSYESIFLKQWSPYNISSRTAEQHFVNGAAAQRLQQVSESLCARASEVCVQPNAQDPRIQHYAPAGLPYINGVARTPSVPAYYSSANYGWST